ncbi:MAG: UDP-N-acetylmuramoyl-L-alanyl-D-glutamate--2,6-diaminopimelate ligase [Calditrichia bacterium]
MIALNKLLQKIKTLDVRGDTNRFVRDLQYDSRLVEPDAAFIAIRGYRTDGHDFIHQAYEKGARVFFVEKDVELPGAAFVKVADTRRALPQIARIFFNYPDHKLKLIGITGTNGKTTTAYLIHSILKQAHWSPGLVSTVEYFDGKQWEPAERTTPESLDLLRLFSRMVNAGLKSAVMEVSSHALSLHRVEGIPFVAGVFTNLGRDHLDFHETEEKYFLAKRKLFETFGENQKAVLNADDPYSRRIRQASKGEFFTFSMQDPSATVSYVSHRIKREGLQLQLRIPSGMVHLESALLGNFNIYNIMAAVTVAISLGLQENYIVDGVRGLLRVPGRCERYSTSAGFSVYIDYAHTPQGLQNILGAVLETRPHNLIVVFGAGGDRDKGKRPQMGKAAEDFADQVVITSDNPRSEDPNAIINDILQGIYDRNKVTVIPDRKEAIHEALSRANKRDAVVIAGKGHEKYQEIAGKRNPFDDHQIVRDFFREKGWEIDI